MRDFSNQIELPENYHCMMDWGFDTKEDVVGTIVFVNDENQFVSNDTKIFQYSNSPIPPFKVKTLFHSTVLIFQLIQCGKFLLLREFKSVYNFMYCNSKVNKLI